MHEELFLAAIANATSPAIELSISERRKLVASNICQLIDADVWLWFTGVVNAVNAGDSMVTSFVDGGFQNESERAEFFRVIIHPELVAVANRPLSDAMTMQRTITCRRVELLTDETYLELPLSNIWRRLGFDDFIISAFPVGASGYSAIGLHRRISKPRFTAEDMRIVNVISHCLSWLHLAVPPTKASQQVLQLSPRERQVVMFLIAGDSRKQVAKKLGISEYTASDYMKAIYTKFSVNSRAELLAKFIEAETEA
jgi:DNA-binding CsgD family transcriptional regulator